MFMKRARAFWPFLLTITLVLVSCNYPTNPKIIERYVAGTQTEEAAYPIIETQPEETANQFTADATLAPPAPVSRCELFPEANLPIFLLEVYPESSSLILYVEFPEGVTGLEDGTEDGFPWEYSANLGDMQSTWCALFEGEDYAGRLYCMLPLPKEYQNAAKPFSLYVNYCESPIVTIPALSVMVEEKPAVGSSNGSGGSGSETTPEGYAGIIVQLFSICGSEPPGGFTCKSEYADWCTCMSGSYECSGEGMGLETNMCHFP
jgi:hypothetical protein